MKPINLASCRSLLFLPASNPRAVAKARSTAADMIFLDLEDAVREEHKTAAREGAIAATAAGFGGRPVAIRMNPAGSQYHDADAVCLRGSAADFAILAKAESAEQVRVAAANCGKPVLAMIETPAAVLNAVTIAQACAGLIAGTNDLAHALQIPLGEGRHGLILCLQTIVLAGRHAGVPVFDGVYNALEDEAGLEAECVEGRAFGFNGKTLIHPNQIAVANRVFAPTPEQVAAAERLIAAATGGAERHEGRMIEAMHVEQARLILARAHGSGNEPESLA